MKRGPSIIQQSLARFLSVINYDKHPTILPKALNYLLDSVKPSSKADVETRRSCFQAMPRILALVSPRLTLCVSKDVFSALFDALLGGLDDYTIDERGDVGSWVRIACIQGLTAISELMFRMAGSIPDFADYFPGDKYTAAVAGLLKQGVERLDNVRQEAGICLMRLLNNAPPRVDGADRWRLPGLSLLIELFQNPTEEAVGWNEGSWLFPRAMRLLEVPEYRKHVLVGVVLSIGSKTDSTQRPVAHSFVKFAQGLPLSQTPPAGYCLLELVTDLINHAKSNMIANAVVVPVFQTFTLLLEADALRQLPNEANGMQSLKTLLHMTTQNIGKIKSVQRIHESMKIVVNLLSFEHIRSDKAALLNRFLTHAFPRVRSDTAEYLYVFLQSADLGFETEAIEDVLLETEWSTGEAGAVQQAANEVIQMFTSGG
ncbi:unnamed protein product [Cyclocybe aegerita]|uniref:Tubulin-folding cofactor D C-terminal domain-containing protein n=1 Tax=Cyclocybe aegerita TaxID=1973307 RepID=A0A8S0WXV6_CYCAE|nr:unnamed protein product [Cyclocybe aegerita]